MPSQDCAMPQLCLSTVVPTDDCANPRLCLAKTRKVLLKVHEHIKVKSPKGDRDGVWVVRVISIPARSLWIIPDWRDSPTLWIWLDWLARLKLRIVKLARNPGVLSSDLSIV